MKSRIKSIKTTIIHQEWSTLKQLTYEYQKQDGSWETQKREAYDRGDGVTILLFNKKRNSVILTRQFRIPTFLNGNEDGMLIEACAGKLDVANPEECIIREVEEETGYAIKSPQKIFELYMSPGSVTEKIHFYTAPYEQQQRVSQGGGKESEQENIEVLEMSFPDALLAVKKGDIRDAKTILLLQFAVINRLLEEKETLLLSGDQGPHHRGPL
ncbi:MAG: NUDIX domain-containing protein [Bacteriovoracia bacterium]